MSHSRAFPRAVLLSGCLTGGLFFACQKSEGPPQEKPSLALNPNQLPALELREETPGLLLTWIDEKGDFHVVQKPSDVPKDGREAVRVVVATKEEGTGKLLYVTNLNEVTPEGSYRVRTMTRAAWDELGASRRKARLESLAPSAIPPSATSESPGSPPGKRPMARGLVAIIYGAEWCKPCHEAESYLKRRGITVIKKDIDADEVAAQEMHRKLERAGRAGSSIPVIDIAGQVLVGFNPTALDQAIESTRNAKPL